MADWRIHAVMLPDGDAAEDRWLTPTGWSDHSTPDAEELPGGFALPGLVDAHSHVSFGMGGDGPIPLHRDRAEEHRVQWASDGVALIRDAGGAPEVVMSLQPVPGRPYVIAAGRHLAPAGMYFEAVHRPVEADCLVETALSELASGAAWVKLVADFTPASRRASHQVAPEPTYDLDVLRELVTAVHAAGGRVAAHVTTELVGALVGLGIDSVEHGTSLDEPTLAEMAQHGTAWTPTLCAVLASPPDATPERRRVVAERHERLKHLLPSAIRLGIPVLTGSDVVGSIPREVELLVECGLGPIEALRAATTTAQNFLARDCQAAPAAVVTYQVDPREDPAILAHPAAVLIGGGRVRLSAPR
jgi:imidazolonepropionase-like amidohydrolase